MKTKLTFFVFLLYMTLNLCNTITVNSQIVQEQWVENVNIPNTNLDGINPEDIVFANGKYFVWGLGAVLVIDPQQDFSIVNTLTISESAQYHYNSTFPILLNPPHAPMVFDGTNKLFVLSPDNIVFVINTTGIGSLESTTIAKPSEDVPDFFFERSIIRYDQLNKRLFWLIYWKENNNHRSVIGCYDVNVTPSINLWPGTEENYEIYDIAINDGNKHLYLSCNDDNSNFIKVCPSDAGNLQDARPPIPTDGYNKDLLYIHTTSLHRIYCISENHIYWIDGDYYYTKDFFPAPENNLNCLTYCTDYNRLIISGSTIVHLYDGVDPLSYHHEINLDPNDNNNLTHYVECFNNKIYACTPNEIFLIEINGEDVYDVHSVLYKKNNYFYSAAIDPLTEHVLICNTDGASLENLNAYGTFVSSILTGISVFKSCTNPEFRKFYFYSDEIRDDSKLAIINYTNASYNVEEIIGFDHNISACAYNAYQGTHHLLVSSFTANNQVCKYNGETNVAAGYLALENGYCENVFITPEPDNKIYCATGMNSLEGASIEIFNSDYTVKTILSNLGNGFENTDFRMKFCYDSKDGFIFFILYKRSYDPDQNHQWGYLGKINLSDEITPLTMMELDFSPEEIKYCSKSNCLYVMYTNHPYVTFYDCENLTNTTTFDYENYIEDIEYAENSDLIYILTYGQCYAHACTVRDQLNDHSYTLPFYTHSLKYNPLNNKIYAYSACDINPEGYHNSWLYVIDPITGSVSDVDLHNQTIWRFEDYLTKNDMVIDPVSGYMLCPNGSHSNISVIECPERLKVNKGVNWISFPRLIDRNEYGEYSAEEALTNRIHPAYSTNISAKLEIKKAIQGTPNTNQTQYIEKRISYDNWYPNQGGLYYVASHLGYILTSRDINGSRVLDLYGTVLNPSTTFPLYGNVENWTGYFLPITQSPLDAISPEIQDKIWWMAGQYWYCHKQSPPHTKTTGYTWRCACGEERFEVKYGEMIKIFPTEDIASFYWQTIGQPPQIEPKVAAENFLFQEQPSYDPYLIELDTSNLPVEIGAFAGDSCVGATKVLPNDTIALIRGFSQGLEGEPVSFEFYYGPEKSSNGRIHSYMVSTPGQDHRMKRTILAGEKQPWFDISFKTSEDSFVKSVQAWLTCSPNPFNRTCTINFGIPEDGLIKLEAIDIFGRTIQLIDNGYKVKGEYTALFAPRATYLEKGVFFIRLTCANEILTKKLVYVD